MKKNLSIKIAKQIPLDNRPVLNNSSLTKEQLEFYLLEKKSIIEYNMECGVYPPEKTLEQLMSEIKLQIGTDEGVYFI